MRIASFSDMRLEVDVDETQFRKLKLNQPADIVLDSLPDKVYKGYIAKIRPQLNRQKGTAKVEIVIVNSDDKLRPEMSAKVIFKSFPRQQTDTYRRTKSYD